MFTTNHNGVEITYDERENLWKFTLRDRDRTAESLAKAKEFIDKPVPRNERKPFKRIPVWFAEFGAMPKKAEVTGLAEQRSYGTYVWINCGGERSKESARDLYPQGAKNDALFAQILAKIEEKEALSRDISELEGKLTKLVLPKED